MVKISYTRIKKVFRESERENYYLLFTPISLPYNIHIKQNVLHNFGGRCDNAKHHRFYCIFKRSSVFFHMFDWLFFIMIMNRLHCEGRMLKCIKQSLDLFPSNSGSNSSRS